MLHPSSQITPVEKPAVVKPSSPYPVQYCQNLLEHTYNGSISDMLIGYTNRPKDCEDCDDLPASRSLLVSDLMDRVVKASEDFLWPFCNLTSTVINNVDGLNFTLWNSTEEQGRLGG